jgi:peptide subunit release factor RF-3
MKLQVARTGRMITASRPQKMMGDDREIVRYCCYLCPCPFMLNTRS